MKSYTLRGGGKVHLCSSILFPCKRSRLQKDRRVTQSGMEVHKYLKSSTKPIYEHKLWHKQKAKKKDQTHYVTAQFSPEMCSRQQSKVKKGTDGKIQKEIHYGPQSEESERRYRRESGSDRELY